MPRRYRGDKSDHIFFDSCLQAEMSEDEGHSDAESDDDLDDAGDLVSACHDLHVTCLSVSTA